MDKRIIQTNSTTLTLKILKIREKKEEKKVQCEDYYT